MQNFVLLPVALEAVLYQKNISNLMKADESNGKSQSEMYILYYLKLNSFKEYN